MLRLIYFFYIHSNGNSSEKFIFLSGRKNRACPWKGNPLDRQGVQCVSISHYQPQAGHDIMSLMKQKLKIAPDVPDYISSVRGIGYKFNM